MDVYGGEEEAPPLVPPLVPPPFYHSISFQQLGKNTTRKLLNWIWYLRVEKIEENSRKNSPYYACT